MVLFKVPERWVLEIRDLLSHGNKKLRSHNRLWDHREIAHRMLSPEEALQLWLRVWKILVKNWFLITEFTISEKWVWTRKYLLENMDGNVKISFQLLLKSMVISIWLQNLKVDYEYVSWVSTWYKPVRITPLSLIGQSFTGLYRNTDVNVGWC